MSMEIVTPSLETNCDNIQDGISLQHCVVGHKLLEVKEEDCDYPDWPDSESEPIPCARRFACFTGSVTPNTLLSHDSPLEYDTNIDAERVRLVQELANRAFSLGSLLELLCVLLDSRKAFAEIQGLAAAYVCHSDIPLDEWPDLFFFDPASTQTWEVTYRLLVPLSQRRQCAFAKILSGHEECLAQRMVSHTWDNIFVDTIAACVAAVQAKGYFFHIRPRLRSIGRVQELIQDLGSEALATTFWLCSISVNQHTVACHHSPWPCPCGMEKITDGPLSEVGCFDLMMRYLDATQPEFAQVVAVDEEAHVRVQIKGETEASQSPKRKSPIRKSIGGQRSSTTWCGFQVKWTSRCIVSVNGTSNAQFSRNVFVGDIIASVDGTSDLQYMREALCHGTGDVTLVLLRKMSVTTRVWVVAEIAEAHRRKIPQFVVCHFPLALSGPEHKFRVKTADVSVSEASKVTDRDMILARIGRNADDYNRRLKRTLLATPVHWRLILAVFVLPVYFLLYVLNAWDSLKDGDYAAACGYICDAWEKAFALWASVFFVRYQWMLHVWHDARSCENLQNEMCVEVRKYLTISSNPLWTRPFLCISVGLGWPWKRRATTIALILLICALPVDLAEIAGLYDGEIIGPGFCRDRRFILVKCVCWFMVTFAWAWAFTEQSASLSGKGATTISVLCAPFVIFMPTYRALCREASFFVPIVFLVGNVCVTVFAQDVFRKPVSDAMKRACAFAS